MKIQVWSDFVCPFCYMGDQKFEMALEQFEHKDEVEVEFKSFELNMEAHSEGGKNIHQIIADKYGVSYEQAKANNDQIVAAAKEVGLNYDFDQLKPNNTLLAHQVAQYAKEHGKEYEVVRALFSGYFEHGKDIGEEAFVFEVAKNAGLDLEDLKKSLSEGSLKNKVRNDEQKAQSRGVQGVPYFLIDDTYAVSGAQSPELFLKALRQAYDLK